MIDRALYMPSRWLADRDRCAEAGVPEEREFATKPQLATRKIGRALDAHVPVDWVAGDEVYGTDPDLRTMLQDRQIGYVLAIGCDRRIPTHGGDLPAVDLAATVPEGCWQQLSDGAGAKGDRLYSWAWITSTETPNSGGSCSLMIRRNDTAGELAFYRCYTPRPVSTASSTGPCGAAVTRNVLNNATKTAGHNNNEPNPQL